MAHILRFPHGEPSRNIKYHKVQTQDGEIVELPDCYLAVADRSVVENIATLSAQLVIAALRHEGVLPPRETPAPADEEEKS